MWWPNQGVFHRRGSALFVEHGDQRLANAHAGKLVLNVHAGVVTKVSGRGANRGAIPGGEGTQRVLDRSGNPPWTWMTCCAPIFPASA